MSTTLHLPDDLVEDIQLRAAREGRGVDETVAELLRAGLAASASLGQKCRREGVSAGSLDLLIATVAIHHDAELITFDFDFERIASVSALRVKWLVRPA